MFCSFQLVGNVKEKVTLRVTAYTLSWWVNSRQFNWLRPIDSIQYSKASLFISSLVDFDQFSNVCRFIVTRFSPQSYSLIWSLIFSTPSSFEVGQQAYNCWQHEVNWVSFSMMSLSEKKRERERERERERKWNKRHLRHFDSATEECWQQNTKPHYKWHS